MNIIQQRDRTDFYNDRYKSPRFSDKDYIGAFNSAIISLFKDKVENKKLFRKYSVESSEMLRRELYPLIKKSTIVPVANLVTYPVDYEYFIELNATVNGITKYSRPTTYNKRGPLADNPFRRPKPDKTYWVENATGILVLCGTGNSCSSAELVYLKKPNVVTWGEENDKISAGGTLVPATQYIVYEDCVENGVAHYSGEIFAAATAFLTSGVVIPVSVVVNCDLPDNVHDEVCRKASDLMQLSIEDYNKYAVIDKEIEKQ